MNRRAAFAIIALLWLGGCARKPAPAPPPPPPITRLLFGGDVMLSRYVGRLARQHQDPAWPFRQLASYLRGADIAFINLESPFSDRGAPVEKGMIFKAEPAMIEGLALAGIDVVSTANNHARDQGSYGLDYTLRWLGQHGISAAGSGTEVVLDRNGVQFGFLAYTYDQSNGNHADVDDRVTMLDISRMTEAVARLRFKADVVIVSMHAGDEYRERPNPQQIEFARAAIETGAAVVVGHHPHVTQPVERYRDGVIFYSLGNLVFDQFQRTETQQGLLAEVVFRGAKLESFRTIPVWLRNTAPEIAGP